MSEEKEKQSQGKKEIFMKKLFERQQEARVIRKIVLIAFSVILIVIGGTALGGYLYIKSALNPMDPEDNKTVPVEIPIGSGVTTIGEVLEEKGIIKNSLVFKYYVKFNNESGFQAGSYDLTPSMTMDEIIASLKTGKVIQDAVFKLTIPEGLQLDQIASIIAEGTEYTEDEVMNKVTDVEWIKELQTKHPTLLTDDIFNENVKYPLEGYLFPATYSFYEENPSLEAIIEKMIAQTEESIVQFDTEMTPHELLTMASLIEEEATEKADREKISSVFYNRLEVGMPLQTDPTVLYALGEHKSRTVYEDLEVDSPYNTYQNTGLPPGPIANAGNSSLKAAVAPEDTPFYYFLASSEGTVYYSETLDEHNEKKAQYITNNQ